MTVKLTGSVNGENIILTYDSQGDRWISIIPPSLNGIFVVDLTAWDEAGNMTYCTKYIITIDLDALCIHLEPYPYYSELLDRDYGSEIIIDRYHMELIAFDICSEIEENGGMQMR
jgi:hypothetical protein